MMPNPAFEPTRNVWSLQAPFHSLPFVLSRRSRLEFNVGPLLEDPVLLPVEKIESNLVLCASCVGYLEESGRYEVRDLIVPECVALVHMLRKMLPDGEDRVLRLARDHPVPWARYYAAAAIERDFPSVSCAVYKELQFVGGIVSAVALVAEKLLAQPKH